MTSAFEQELVFRNKLKIFLYLLMRDTVPVGEVTRIINEIEKFDDIPLFSLHHLESLAWSLSDRILK